MAHTPSSPHIQQVRLLTYTLPGGWQVLVGRTDADNDYLSFRVARPEDWWFHIRGMPGSHVILQGPPGADPDRETLQRAAAIAAYLAHVPMPLPALSCARPLRYGTLPGWTRRRGPLAPAA
jgi:hypothetical protein